eukprot:5262186-Amphidinium_carterae.1
MKPKEPEDEDNKTTGLQQLLSISLHYAPTLFDNLKQRTSMGYEKEDGKKLRYYSMNKFYEKPKYSSST